MTVGIESLDRDEQVAGLDAARVVGDADDLRLAVGLDSHAGHAMGQLMELHREAQHNRHVIADISGRRFEWGARTYVMGIINVTPDSFSGDGLGDDQERAVSQGLRMVREGADMLDVGGESTRPGHQPITAAEEIARTEAVVARLARDADVPISIDTYKLVSGA